MKRGPAPKPSALKRLTGYAGHRAINEHEPKPRLKLPAAPAMLSTEAKRLWRSLGKRLLAMGLITEIDSIPFSILCESYTTWQTAIEKARGVGILVNINGQPTPNPYLQLAHKSAEQCRKLLAEFGLSPAARSRVSVTPPPDEDDEFGKMLRERS